MSVKYACLVNYNHDPQDWWREFGIEAIVYDRSDDGVERQFDANVRRTANRGNVDFDKLDFLVEFYHDLPEVFLWSKTNIFKYVDKETLTKALEKGEFTPLMKKDHPTYSDKYGEVCRYLGDWYEERNDSWYLGIHPAYSFKHFGEWASHFRLPSPAYLPFPPGGSFILTRERVHRYGQDFYREMRDTLPHAQVPGEAFFAERSYGLMWK